MGTVSYCNFGGMLVSENRNGVKRDYVPDPEGSTVALLDDSQTKTDTFTYWPYGELRTSTGAAITAFRFLGGFCWHSDDLDRIYTCEQVFSTKYGRPTTALPATLSKLDPQWFDNRTFVSSHFIVLTPNSKTSHKVPIANPCDPLRFANAMGLSVYQALSNCLNCCLGVHSGIPCFDELTRCLQNLKMRPSTCQNTYHSCLNNRSRRSTDCRNSCNTIPDLRKGLRACESDLLLI